jgi:hypothetical protein
MSYRKLTWIIILIPLSLLLFCRKKTLHDDNGDVDTTETGLILIGAYESANPLLDVFVDSEIAYVIDGDKLIALDISNPGEIVMADEIQTPGQATAVFVLERIAYIADGDSGLTIITTTTPSNLILSGHVPLPWEVDKVFALTDKVFLTGSDSSIFIINTATPYEPVYLTAYGGDDEYTGIYAIDNCLLTTRYWGFLCVIDISAPASPSIIDSLWAFPTNLDVAVQGNLLYILGNHTMPLLDECLQIFHISNPEMPDQMGEYWGPWGREDTKFAVSYPYIYTMNDYQLRVYDVSDPQNIQRIAAFAMDNANGIFAEGEYIYIARDTGFEIYTYVPE